MPADEKAEKGGTEKRTSVSVRIPRKPPPIFGYSDGCAVIDREFADEIVFLDSIGRKALARIVVDHGARADQLWAGSAAFYEQMRKILMEKEIAPTSVSGLPSGIEQSVIPVACNVFRLFKAGMEASFEGYYVSPGALHMARAKQEAKPLEALPVCHVQMSLPLLVGLLEAIRARVKGAND